VTSYKSSIFLILLGSFDENADNGNDEDPDVGVFLLLNTWNLCIGVCGSSIYTIGPFVSAIGTSTSSLRIRSILIHLTSS